MFYQSSLLYSSVILDNMVVSSVPTLSQPATSQGVIVMEVSQCSKYGGSYFVLRGVSQESAPQTSQWVFQHISLRGELDPRVTYECDLMLPFIRFHNSH